MKYIKICPICKKEFETDRKCRVYCSQECANVGYSKSRVFHKVCAICGSEFETYSRYKQYCCPECSKEGIRQSRDKEKKEKLLRPQCRKLYQQGKDFDEIEKIVGISKYRLMLLLEKDWEDRQIEMNAYSSNNLYNQSIEDMILNHVPTAEIADRFSVSESKIIEKFKNAAVLHYAKK